ncbi:MAG: protein kinase domain-containing protein [Kiritimatiellia bacterium]
MTELRIPGFEILEKIGEGGMATVWKARQISLDRIVAIKVLAAKLASHPAQLENFRAEAQAAARLRHRGIVDVYDAHISDELCYFVMEYVGGYTVGDWIRRKGRISERDALLAADCVANALHYAWETERLIHRDIKPDNLIIDTDGTLKIGDLGVALSQRVRPDGSNIREIVGTPDYMSPEQARGESNLDCRSDIYSLGATLYHMVTGHTLFQGSAEEKVLELQISGVASSPLDSGADVSLPFVKLLEVMLAKRVEDRPRDWPAVRTDIHRVQRKLLPLNRLPAGAASTVQQSLRTPTTMVQQLQQASRLPTERRPRVGAIVALAILLSAVCFLSWRAVHYRRSGTSYPEGIRSVKPEKESSAVGSQLTDAASQKAFESVVRWVKDHPGEEAEAIGRFQQIVTQFHGSHYAALAEAEIRRLSAVLEAESRAVLERLQEETAPLIEKGDFLRAAEIYELYGGKRAAETRVQRSLMARQLRRQYEEAERYRKEEEQKSESAVRSGVERIAAALFSEGIESAIARAEECLKDETLKAGHKELTEVHQFLLRAVVAADRAIAASFTAQKGFEVTVQLASGPCRMFVTEVQSGRVVGEQRMTVGEAYASRPVGFGLNELAIQEKWQRLNTAVEPEVMLVKGLIAARLEDYSAARDCFTRIPPPLRDVLLSRVAAKEEELAEATGKQGPPQAPSQKEDLADTVADPESVLNMLVAKNPGLTRRDIRVDESDEKGATIRLTITSSQLVDISPLSALKTLKELRCRVGRGSAGDTVRNKLQDLTPLKGLLLERLEVSRSFVRDLRPLQGMPLRHLDVSFTEVSELSPLRDLPLQSLLLGNSKVRLLARLAGMKLHGLDLSDLPLADLRGLEGMPLHDLNLSGTSVWDLNILKGMPLQRLVLANTRFSNFAQLQDLPLEALDLSRTAVRTRDLALLAGKPLKELDLSDTAVTEISALKDLPLERLSLARTQIKDFSPLRGGKLTWLDLSGASVSELSWLKGMPLKYLNISRTSVRDLSPIHDLPLVELDCRGVKAKDFNPLMGTSIEVLWIDDQNLSPVLLRFLPRLRKLNGVNLLDREAIGNFLRELERRRRR